MCYHAREGGDYNNEIITVASVFWDTQYTPYILSLQPISRDVADTVTHPRRLDPTKEFITYSFVLYLQHGCHDVKYKPSINILRIFAYKQLRLVSYVAFQTIDIEVNNLIVYCLNVIRHD